MSSSSSSFVNPSSISEPGPSRKRPRSDVSSEERKEARAHRNRIAAQNSRDRRKIQFSQLERRVQELEEENRQLRAGYGLAPTAQPKSSEQDSRDRENEELRDRIKTLEKGWDAVVKALAAQGLPGLGLAAPETCSASASTPSPAPAPRSETKRTITEHPQIVVPLSPASSTVADEDSPMFSADSTAYSGSPSPKSESTRHLARVANISVAAPPIPFPETPITQDVAPVDDTTMENLFREILATSPAPTQEAVLPGEPEATLGRPEITFEGMAGKGTPGSLLLSGTPEDVAWLHEELDVQRLLDLLPMDTHPVENWEFSFENGAIGVY